MIFEDIYEALMFRGIGTGSNSKHIRWVTPNKNVASGYAKSRGGISGGRVVELDIDPNFTADLGHDSLRVNASKFIGMVSRNAPNKNKEVIPYINRFREYFGEESRRIIDFWSTEDNKKETVSLLKAMGYDSIKVHEANEITYGILR